MSFFSEILNLSCLYKLLDIRIDTRLGNKDWRSHQYLDANPKLLEWMVSPYASAEGEKRPLEQNLKESQLLKETRRRSQKGSRSTMGFTWGDERQLFAA